jgi:hypothetical protein
LQSGAADEVEPGEVGVAVEQSRAGGGDEERGVAPVSAELVTAAVVRGSASTVLGCSGICRDLPNLDSWIRNRPATTSTSLRSSRSASPMRSPVTANNPIRVSKVAARSGEGSWRAALISAARSTSDYR